MSCSPAPTCRALLDELCRPGNGAGPERSWRCPAPDHDDVHPSVTMTVDRRGIQRWRCWSGGHGGTAIDAIHVAFRVSYRRGDRVPRSPMSASSHANPGHCASARPMRPPPSRCRSTNRRPLRRALRADPVGAARPARARLPRRRARPRPRGAAGQPGRRRPRHQQAPPRRRAAPRPGPAPCSRRSTRDGGSPTADPLPRPDRTPLEVRQPGQPARRQPTPRLDPARRLRRSRR